MPTIVARRKVRQGNRKPRQAPILLNYEIVKDRDGEPRPKVKSFIYLNPIVITKLRKHKLAQIKRQQQAQQRKKKKALDRLKTEATPTPPPPTPSPAGPFAARTRFGMMQYLAIMSAIWRVRQQRSNQQHTR